MLKIFRIFFLLAASLASSLAATLPAASAEQALLARTEIKIKIKTNPAQAQGTVATAELWGERLASGYARDLLLLVKDADGRMLAAHASDIKGGYHCFLQPVRVRANKNPAQDEQILLSVAQGDWQSESEYRVLEFAAAAQESAGGNASAQSGTNCLRQIFSGADSMGLVRHASLDGKKLRLRLADGSEETLPLAEEPDAARARRLRYGGLHSLSARDADGDGADELFCTQSVYLGGKAIAEVGGTAKIDAENKIAYGGFALLALRPEDAPNTKNHVNDGAESAAGAFLPRRVLSAGGEATYPLFACKEIELQNKVNALLREGYAPDLDAFYADEADAAFQIKELDEEFASVQFLSRPRGKEGSFAHHHVNIDLASGKLLALADLFRTEDEDFLPLLKLLCTNKKMLRTHELPDEWFISGGNLYLMERAQSGDEFAGFALGNLHKFAKRKFPAGGGSKTSASPAEKSGKNLTDQSVVFKNQRKQELDGAKQP